MKIKLTLLIILSSIILGAFYILEGLEPFHSKPIDTQAPQVSLNSPLTPNKTSEDFQPLPSIPEATSTPPAKPLVSQSEFKSLIQNTLETIPTLNELSGLSTEEVHLTPRKLIAAGVKIAEIASLVESNPELPELKEQGIEFFDQCVENAEYPDSIRTVCYTTLRDISPNTAQKIEIPESMKTLLDSYPFEK